MPHHVPRLVALTLVAVFACAPDARAAEAPDPQPAKPWLHTYGEPTRTFYVSPDGTGAGTSKAEPMSLAAAVAGATAGDLYWLLEGTYRGGLLLDKPGTREKPIVFRAAPGGRATVVGQVVVKGTYNWVWGLEVT